MYSFNIKLSIYRHIFIMQSDPIKIIESFHKCYTFRDGEDMYLIFEQYMILTRQDSIKHKITEDGILIYNENPTHIEHHDKTTKIDVVDRIDDHFKLIVHNKNCRCGILNIEFKNGTSVNLILTQYI